jgi:hypothetical protein
MQKRGPAHIGVVVARHHGDPVARSQAFEEVARDIVLAGQSQIHKVAGDGEMIEAALQQISGEHTEPIRIVMDRAPRTPVEIADRALADQLRDFRPRHRRQMRIGQMGEGEHGCLCSGE